MARRRTSGPISRPSSPKCTTISGRSPRGSRLPPRCSTPCERSWPRRERSEPIPPRPAGRRALGPRRAPRSAGNAIAAGAFFATRPWAYPVRTITRKRPTPCHADIARLLGFLWALDTPVPPSRPTAHRSHKYRVLLLSIGSTRDRWVTHPTTSGNPQRAHQLSVSVIVCIAR